jgi:hypothetical protein
MLFKSLLSPIKSITSNLLESNTTTSSITGSTLAPFLFHQSQISFRRVQLQIR